jgi:hypothetical protein
MSKIYDFNMFVIECVLFASIGIILSGFVEGLFDAIDKYVINMYQIIRLLSQIGVSAVVAFAVSQIKGDFSDTWQSTIPGLFFVSLFFGRQGTFYKNIL